MWPLSLMHSGQVVLACCSPCRSSAWMLLDRMGWTMQGPPKAGLSQADAAQLEERALKMRKAMGENISDDVAGETVDARMRRLNLIKCAFFLKPAEPFPSPFRSRSVVMTLLASILSRSLRQHGCPRHVAQSADCKAVPACLDMQQRWHILDTFTGSTLVWDLMSVV